ncbi:malectin domain-containing carbohydrate-binding protein [Gephyromycinifex aptenodytis]|uniref:malectin domain-containing carbohydrate-binding protein n=1 Tax=Gephyromycinifex aptenodytis TaxID=2716227 RepID=UPI0014470437|nr:malectin domain-containing carbohydrate-binding protein [Gephyromycinifex aptenodytis]
MKKSSVITRPASAITTLALAVTMGGAALTMSQPAQAAVGDSFRMTVADTSYRDSAGRTWAARAGFDTGDFSPSYWAPTDIKGTSEDALYYPELVRMNSWSKQMENGTYRVTLKMRESWWTKAGDRVFSVSAEGQPKLSNIDIFAAVGKGAAYDRTFDVTVKDGRLDLGFTATKDSAALSALEVTRIADPAPAPTPAPDTSSVVARMTTSTKPIKGTDGTYEGRSGFVGGWSNETLFSDGRDVKGTTNDAPYRPEYIHMSAWQRAVPNGTYDVTLMMREAYFSSAGERVFSVTAEGRPQINDLDLIKTAGKDVAYNRTFRVEVKDGRLDLGFTGKVNGATVSAIVLSKVGGSGTPAPTPTTPAPTPSTPAPTTPAPTPTTPAPTPTTPAPTTPAPGSSKSNFGKQSGLLFDSGMYPMNKAGEVTKWENARGKKVDVITVFPSRESWNNMQSTWFMDNERIPAGYKGTLDVGVPLWPNDGNLSTAAAGGYNAEWERLARNISARYPDAYIRLGWEMNLPSWKAAAYPNTADQWKQAYRQAVGAIRKGGPNLRIAWVVNEGPGQTGTKDAAIFYPGDAYVDYIGMDAYDWWPGYTTDANIARHRDEAYGWNHWLNFAKAHGKKFVLPEWGIAPANSAGGGDNPKYINFVYNWLKQNQEHIAYESYFSESMSYIRSDLFTCNSPKASAEYKRWMPLLTKTS